MAWVTVLGVAALAGLLATWPLAKAVPDEHVVARARTPDGHEIVITAGRLRAYAEGREDGDPRRLVQDLIDFELLAAQAAARGLADRPAVRSEARQVMVRRYLRGDFEPRYDRDAIPRELLRQAYDRNRWFFDHEEGRVGVHILVTTSENQRPEDPELDRRARALAERIRAELAAEPPADPDAFLAAAERYREQAEAAGLVVRGENLGGFPRHGRYVDAFTEQAFALTEPGSLTPAFPTRFGYHVFRLTEVIPERHVSFEDAEAELRERTLPDFRRQRLRELTDALGRELGVVVNFEPLRQLQARRGLTEADSLAPEGTGAR